MKKKIILVMGLSGAGKSFLSIRLAKLLNAEWINADKVRKKYNDWDFSLEGRIRQAKRMKKIALEVIKKNKNVIVDFICPTAKTRKDFGADYIVWVDTITASKYADTNQMFEKPKKYDFRVTSKEADKWSIEIFKEIQKIFN